MEIVANNLQPNNYFYDDLYIMQKMMQYFTRPNLPELSLPEIMRQEQHEIT